LSAATVVEIALWVLNKVRVKVWTALIALYAARVELGAARIINILDEGENIALNTARIADLCG
jgi:hypothetical protein